ncbi:unnamed protein product, partial [marine sediment metagenome]
MKSLFKKAQESRKDLLIWYGICFLIVILIVAMIIAEKKEVIKS